MFGNISYNANEAAVTKPHSLFNRAGVHVIAFALCELHLFF